ncbi:MAG: SurA N-terminal domain-containing protein [Bacteroidales bacterium]|nr:SurA N-terminal domain-containing protein [Bacteroidales bacterium]
MAVIGNIRKRSGLLIVIVGVALAAFVLGDFLKPGSGRRNMMNIGEIYGEEIPITQFNERVEQNIEIQKRNQQKESLDAGEIFKVKDQTWKQITQQIIMAKEYDLLGLKVTSDELYDLVQGDEPHKYISSNFVDPETQQYNPELVRNYLQNLNQMEAAAKNQW